MSDTTIVPQGTPAPSAPPAPPIVPPAAPPPVVAPPPKQDGESEVRMSPAQLRERLAEERVKGEKAKESALAAELGIPLADAKKLISDAKAKDDAAKSEVQKLTEQNAAKDAKLARLTVLEEAVTARAATEFATLSAEQQQAVEKLAGDDPAARLRTIDALKPTWAAAKAQADADAQAKADAKAAADAAAKAAQPPPPVPSGASTAPAGSPPPAITPGTPTNHLAVYESLKASNPAAAAVYHNKHAAAILAARRNKG